MRCPNCASLDTQVKDSRPTEDSSVIRRRRVCLACNFRFTTFERVQLRELTVIKRNGRRVPFDRDKLLRSVQIALRKRPVEPERIEQVVSKIVRELESQGESEVSSETVGEMVMEALRALDDVAYQPNQSAAMQNAASPACTAAPGHIAAPFAAEAIPAKPRTAAAPRL
jgi:transcriptional repressor NrdR